MTELLASIVTERRCKQLVASAVLTLIWGACPLLRSIIALNPLDYFQHFYWPF